MTKEKEIREILKSVPWLKEPEELDFTAYVYYQVLREIKQVFNKEEDGRQI